MLIVDAGGGTVDINAYVPTSASPGSSFAEVAAPQCKISSKYVADFIPDFIRRPLPRLSVRDPTG